MLFVGITLVFVAWHWNQPKTYANGVFYAQSVPILLLVSLTVNGISFYFQQRYVRSLLKRPHIA
ncbi:MAG: hypothetical protein IGS48_11595 [Oscillatoriales cyanobacterium C42_A2020_001]|nr:hypothetical protein [Leptolyngbyaceae cyanobacterium C42_A2020_001]